ncbi:hypothetical protein GW916_13210 [bacterium]|nr:hypothetical protein [bacterium]
MLSLVLFSFAPPAFGKIFSFDNESLAAVLEGSFGTSHLGQDPFASNIGSGASLSESFNYMGSGKIGFALTPGDRLSFVFALEVLRPLSISTANGLNSSGTPLYQLSSEMIALNPMAAVEYSYSRAGNVRYFAGLGVGMGQVTITNQFDMTSTGESALGVTSYTEKLKGTAINGYMSLGVEAHFVDRISVIVQGGHRIFKVHELKHGSAVTTVAEGSVSEGDTVYNRDGTKRTIDLTGSFVGFGFRIYIP